MKDGSAQESGQIFLVFADYFKDWLHLLAVGTASLLANIKTAHKAPHAYAVWHLF